MHEWVTMDGFYPLLTELSATNNTNNKLDGTSDYSHSLEKNPSRLQLILNTRRSRVLPDFFPRSNSSMDLRFIETESQTPDPYDSNDPHGNTRQPDDIRFCHRRGRSCLFHDGESDFAPRLSTQSSSPQPFSSPPIQQQQGLHFYYY